MKFRKLFKEVVFGEKHVYTCDVCGLPTDHNYCQYVNGKGFVQDEVSPIYATIGTYGKACGLDSDLRFTYALDLCGPCFINKVKPAIETVVAFRKFPTGRPEPIPTIPE